MMLLEVMQVNAKNKTFSDIQSNASELAKFTIYVDFTRTVNVSEGRGRQA